jgi:ribosomal protein S18 acetylase RimI-like enzyme
MHVLFLRLDAEWQALENKTRGRDEAWKHVRVACLVGTAPLQASGDPLAAGLDPSCKLPAENDSSSPRVVLATLDVNIGHSLPAEELCGQHAVRCAFLSNVCCAPGARRMGAARTLVEYAVDYVRARGVRHLYVHVAADNSSAAALYVTAGFAVECEETSTQAHLLSRPRRQLLLRTVQ